MRLALHTSPTRKLLVFRAMYSGAICSYFHSPLAATLDPSDWNSALSMDGSERAGRRPSRGWKRGVCSPLLSTPAHLEHLKRRTHHMALSTPDCSGLWTWVAGASQRCRSLPCSCNSPPESSTPPGAAQSRVDGATTSRVYRSFWASASLARRSRRGGAKTSTTLQGESYVYEPCTEPDGTTIMSPALMR